jgi:hypothetical protein
MKMLKLTLLLRKIEGKGIVALYVFGSLFSPFSLFPTSPEFTKVQ